MSLVIRGREDFHSLSQSEKFQFEQFIEQRMRLFGSNSTTIQNKNGWKILRARAKDFFRSRVYGLLSKSERRGINSNSMDELYR